MTSAVLLHPHPDMGGDQHNNVITALHEALTAIGVRTHRFDFASADPQTARAQTLAAIDGATAPVFLIGYSFGGGIAATVEHESIAAWCLVAPALSLVAQVIGGDPRPKYVLCAERDAWFGPEALLESTEDWAATSHAVLPGADHFFAGADAVAAAALVTRFVQGARAAE